MKSKWSQLLQGGTCPEMLFCPFFPISGEDMQKYPCDPLHQKREFFPGTEISLSLKSVRYSIPATGLLSGVTRSKSGFGRPADMHAAEKFSR